MMIKQLLLIRSTPITLGSRAVIDRCHVLVLVFLLLVAGCSTSGMLSMVGLGKKNHLESVSIEAAIDSNKNMSVAVDILFINGEQLGPLLSAMNGPEWFLRKKELMMRYSEKISVASFEVVPLSFVNSITMPEKSEYAESILLFANYIGSNGQYVSELKSYKQLKLKLQNTEYSCL